MVHKQKNVPLVLLLVIAFVIRVVTLPLRALGIDESFTLSSITAPDLFEPLIIEGFTPPLYYLLASGIHATGGVFALQLFSVLLGVGSIAFVYWFTRDLRGKREALLAAVILTVMPLHLFYSQHMRTYALTFFLFAILLYFIQRYIAGDKRSLIAITMVNALLLYTNYVNGIIWLTQIVFLIFYRKKVSVRWYGISLAVSLASLGPWLTLVIGNTIPQSVWVVFDSSNVGYIFYKLLTAIDISTLLSIHPFLLISFPLALAILIVGGMKLKREPVVFFFIAPIILSILVSFIVPIAHFRFLSYLTIPLAPILASSARENRLWFVFLLIVMGFWIFFDVAYVGISQGAGWNELIGL